jgi:hypothetical protein
VTGASTSPRLVSPAHREFIDNHQAIARGLLPD